MRKYGTGLVVRDKVPTKRVQIKWTCHRVPLGPGQNLTSGIAGDMWSMAPCCAPSWLRQSAMRQKRLGCSSTVNRGRNIMIVFVASLRKRIVSGSRTTRTYVAHAKARRAANGPPLQGLGEILEQVAWRTSLCRSVRLDGRYNLGLHRGLERASNVPLPEPGFTQVRAPEEGRGPPPKATAFIYKAANSEVMSPKTSNDLFSSFFRYSRRCDVTFAICFLDVT